ncbi:tRNA (N6-isopentenyl adenosine(37)-C2)-methylthiotransferase MiaB [Candidatus Peregrinibacteria bacterium]|nr:tRNA (N6-isopentenyl adenosine(37)-C2)-methylthiotransferase MiaB [Candidatus Peregrinibacteria bacterium]
MKYFIQTYGCQMNYSDSERIATVLLKLGYTPAKGFGDADLIILNTCSVKQKAEERIYGLGEQFKPLKEKNPRLKIGITGCMIRQSTGLRRKEGEAIFRRMGSVDFTFRIKELMQLPEILRELHQVEGADDVKDLCSYFHIPQTITNIAQVFIPVMNGCNNFCSYCIVPYARGREESRSMAEVLDETEKAAKRGAKEINLVGQNVNTYKPADADPKNKEAPFAQLLRKIDAIPTVDRVRFYTVHPKDMSDDVIALYGELRTMTPHLHLPVQSGSNSVLKRMNRTYTVERFKELVAKMRARIPHMSISTDIIVGFCGETEKEFMESYDLIKDLKIDLVYVSKYSEREGTLAAREQKDDVPLEVKKDRFRRITDVMRGVSHEYNQQFLGKTVQVLVEKAERGYTFGKIPEYKFVRLKGEKPELIGQYVNVKIKKAMEWCLEGNMTKI